MKVIHNKDKSNSSRKRAKQTDWQKTGKRQNNMSSQVLMRHRCEQSVEMEPKEVKPELTIQRNRSCFSVCVAYLSVLVFFCNIISPAVPVQRSHLEKYIQNPKMCLYTSHFIDPAETWDNRMILWENIVLLSLNLWLID